MTRLLLLLLAEVAAVTATWQASAPYRPSSWPAWGSTLLASSAPDAVVGLVHLAALPAACWLLAGTLHDLGAAALHHRRGTRRGVRGRVVPPWVQRVVDQAVGTTLALAVMAGPAAAATAEPAVAAVAVVTPPVDPVALAPPGHSAMPEASVRVDPAAADRHVVAAGENLWVIARGALTVEERTPTDREVHAYWIRLIQANDVPSGDPDLIHAGDVLQLPPTPAPEDER